MRVVLQSATVIVFSFFVACKSEPQKTYKPRPGEPNPNEHTRGSTDVIKNYRLPDTGNSPKGFHEKPAIKPKKEPAPK